MRAMSQITGATLIALMLVTGPAYALRIFKQCSADEALNFRKDTYARVGYIEELSINGKPLKRELTVTNPIKPSETMQVFAVLFQLSMRGYHHLEFSGMAGGHHLAELRDLILPDTIEFRFTIYEYNPITKRYFASVHTGGNTLRGISRKARSDRNQVSLRLHPEKDRRNTHGFSMKAIPSETSQTIVLAAVEGKEEKLDWVHQPRD